MKQKLSYLFLILCYFFGSAIASTICDNMQKDAEDRLRRAFSIPDADWQKVQRELAEKRDLLAKPRIDYVHDKTIPQKMLQKVCVLLENYGIEPTSIDIQSIESGDLAAVTTDGFELSILQLNVKQLAELREDYFEFVIVHEIGHLLNMHHFRYLIEYKLFPANVIMETKRQIKGYIAQHAIPYEKIKHEGDKKELARFVKAVELLQKKRNNPEVVKTAIKTLQEKLLLLLLVHSLPKEQYEAYCNWRKVREFVADQYIASQDSHMLKKGFAFCASWYEHAQAVGGDINKSWYPSLEESYRSFCENLIKPHKELRYLLKDNFA